MAKGAGIHLGPGWRKAVCLLALAVAVFALAAAGWPHWRPSPAAAVPSHLYLQQSAQSTGWTSFGGAWRIRDGEVRNSSDERGAKLLTGSKRWGNYTVHADLELDGEHGDMGLLLRSNDEQRGLDTYDGYYVGLRTVDGTMVVGRSKYQWAEAQPIPMPGGVHASVWYRLYVTAFGCNIAASVQNLQTRETASIAFEDRSCIETGRVGLRSVDTGGTWRNFAVQDATWSDYLQLRQHAGSVEQPLLVPGPPWWTPWHAGCLFGGILLVALLAQLAYFRMQQWKTYALVEERERLAHEIHDTMAQSFAGVGYQIQGIRNSLVRGDRQDADSITDQLDVAYQLVRRCHEEASKTIAMLGSSPPPIEQNLLGTLDETARRLAGDRIRLIARVHGSATPLNLRLANALLHIGQEAIANAVSHADPSVLAITLTYEEDTVELVVKDNGRGFAVSPQAAGFGILGMQKRARDVAGTLRIVSAPGSGTQVRIRAELQGRRGAKKRGAADKERSYAGGVR